MEHLSAHTAPQAIRAWARLIRAAHTTRDAVEKRLKAAGLPPLSWYDVLLELRRAGTEGMRPVALEGALLIAQYNLSRLVARIETEGLLARVADPEDGRGHRLVIAPAGLALLDRMWPVYDAALSEAVGDRLSDDEAKRLGDLLGKLI